MDLDPRDANAVKPALAELVAAWPLGASLAAVVALRSLRVGRRRMALNEALHELRRPLQALALSAPAGRQVAAPAIEGSLQMAASALERLEREINGEPVLSAWGPVRARTLLEAALQRWTRRAAIAGGSLSLRLRAGEATVAGNRGELSQALDNLIVNAIEHGGPEVVVEARTSKDRLRIRVIDRGRRSRPAAARERPAGLLVRLSGRRRHGHGLRVVRRIAADHGGEFRLRSSERGTEAVLELPLAGSGWSDVP